MDIDVATRACVQWEAPDRSVRSFIDCDPQREDVTLSLRFVAESKAGIQLNCPLRVTGADSHSHIVARLGPLAGFTFRACPSAPQALRRRLDGRCVRLRFQLRQPPTFIAPTGVDEPLQPRMRNAGQTMEAIRGLARATTVYVFVPEGCVSQTQLTALREAVRGGRLREWDQGGQTVLFGPEGGKVVDLTPAPTDEPLVDEPLSEEPLADRPLINELPIDEPLITDSSLDPPNDVLPDYDSAQNTPSPLFKASMTKSPAASSSPPPQPFSPRGTKRRFLDAESTASSSTDTLQTLFSAVYELQKRVHQLEASARTSSTLITQLTAQNDELSAEVALLRRGVDDALDDESVHRMQLREDVDEHEARITALEEGELDDGVRGAVVEKVTEEVLETMLEKNYQAKVVFERV